MPNWCSNNLMIRGSEEDLVAFIAAVAGSDDRGDPCALDFARHAPVPYIDDDDEAIDAQIAAWGTKWRLAQEDITMIDGSPEEEALNYAFYSASEPPRAWLRAVAQQHPDLEFDLTYQEPNMRLAGVLVGAGGQVDER